MEACEIEEHLEGTDNQLYSHLQGKSFLPLQDNRSNTNGGLSICLGELFEHLSVERCCVPKCGNNKLTHPDTVFFPFPDDEIRRHQWVLYCKSFTTCPGWRRFKLTSTSMICSDHFKPDCFVKNAGTLLKRTAVPTLTLLEILSNRASSHFGTYKVENIALQPTEVSFNTACEFQYQDSYSILCRLCASNSEEMVFIFGEEGLSQKLSEKINLCFPFEVTVYDMLPKQVCRPCLSNLNELFDLADLCSCSQIQLMDDFKYSTSEKFLPYISQSCPLCLEGTMCSEDKKLCNSLSTNELNNSLKSKSDFTVCNSESGTDHLLNNDDVEIKNILSLTMEDLDSSSFLFIETKEKDCFTFHSRVGESPNQSDITSFSSPLKIKPELKCSYDLPSMDRHFVKSMSCRICGEYFDVEELICHSFDHSCQNFFQCSLCKSFFSNEDDFSVHLMFHKISDSSTELAYDSSSRLGLPGNKNFKCHICFDIFFSEPAYFKHLKVIHSLVVCRTCSTFFDDEIQLRKHSIEHHLLNDHHSCEDCGKILKSKSSKNYHKIIHHKNKERNYNICYFCGKSFIRRSMLTNHLAKCHISPASLPAECFTCKICYEGFPTKKSAISHMEAHKDENMKKFIFDIEEIVQIFVCEYCERYFNQENYLNFHRQHHLTKLLFECKFCKDVFPIKEAYDNHKLNDHVSIPPEYSYTFNVPLLYSCEYCERFFFHFNKYEEHLSIHYGEMPYECRHCDLKFKSLTEAVEHRMHYPVQGPSIHSALSRPFACHFCSKRFPIEDVLTKHIRMHTGEKPFVCDQCGKGFSQSSGLYTHQKVHSSERPYSCSLCSRKFKIKGDRDVHERKHSGERPYKCEVCGKAFMTQHVYSQHKKIHTGERPYKCDICCSSFRRSHVLTVHKRIHTGEKPHICSFCGRGYRQKGDLLKHCRTQHNYQEGSAKKLYTAENE